MHINDIRSCPICVDGRQINFSKGKTEVCEVCHGLAVVTPNHPCCCGRSCGATKGDIFYCGNEECLKSFESDKRIEGYMRQNLQRPTVSVTYGSDDDDRDYDESFQTPWGAMGHRRGMRGFGGRPAGLNHVL